MSVYHEAPTEVTTPPDGTEPNHAVCTDMIDAIPRLAICGEDCTDVPEGAAHPPYCQLCMTLAPFHLAECPTCRRLFLAGD